MHSSSTNMYYFEMYLEYGIRVRTRTHLIGVMIALNSNFFVFRFTFILSRTGEIMAERGEPGYQMVSVCGFDGVSFFISSRVPMKVDG